MKDKFGTEIEVGDGVAYGRYGGEVVVGTAVKVHDVKHRWQRGVTEPAVTVEQVKYPGKTYERTVRTIVRTPHHIFVYKKKE